MLEELYDNKGWTLSHESEVKVYYRHLKGRACSHLCRSCYAQPDPLCIWHCLIGLEISSCKNFETSIYEKNEIWYGYVPAGDPYHSVKLEAVLEAPIEHVLALAAEYDLTKMWNSFMKASAILYTE